MSLFVVDSNVVIKWFVPEVQSESAIAVVAPVNELMAPDLLLAEVGSIVWKKIRAGDITVEQGKEIVRALSRMPVRLHSTEPLLESALDLACRVGCTVYDAMYVALAVARDCKLMTADRRLLLKFEPGPLARHLQLI